MHTRLRRRAVEFRPSLWPIGQTAVAAGVSWELARRFAHHPTPIFAPIVAIVAMGIKSGRRGSMAIAMVLGVALGLLVAELLVRGVGRGAWQIVAVVGVTMAIAAFIRPEPLFVSQAAISGLLVVVLPAVASARVLDCLIGGVVAFVASAVIFPVDAERLLLAETDTVSDGIAASLEESASALDRRDPELAWRARDRVVTVARLDDALDLAQATARVAPLRFRSRGRVQVYEGAIVHLAAAARTTRLVGGTVGRLLRADGTPPEGIADALRTLAEAAREAPVAIAGSADAARRLSDTADAAAHAARTGARDRDDVRAAALVHLVETLADRLSSAAG